MEDFFKIMPLGLIAKYIKIEKTALFVSLNYNIQKDNI